MSQNTSKAAASENFIMRDQICWDILNKLNEGIACVDADGIIIFMNDAACRVLEYDRDELINKPYDETFHKAGQRGNTSSNSNNFIAKTLHKGEPQSTRNEVFWTKQQAPVTVNYKSTPIRDDDASKVKGAIIIFHDIEHEKALRETIDIERDFIHKIIHQSPYLIVGLSTDGQIEFVNAVICQLTGKTAQELIGEEWWNQFHPDQKNKIAQMRAMFYEHGKVEDFELELRCKSGKLHHVSWTARKQLDHDGNVIRIIGTGVDRTLQNREIRRRKMQALGVMASGVVHEMNNVLQPILTATELLRDVADETDNSTIKKSVDIIERNLNHGRTILRDINLYSRQEQREISKVRPFDLLHELLTTLEEAKLASISFHKDIDDDLKHVSVHIDPTGFSQIVTNLIKNAGDAMGNDGRIHIQMTMTEPSFLPCYHVLDENIYLHVIDEGPGISSENLDAVFDPFFTTKKKSRGTGLGLAISKSIAQSWGGDLTVMSEPGNGACFTLRIPVQKL